MHVFTYFHDYKIVIYKLYWFLPKITTNSCFAIPWVFIRTWKSEICKISLIQLTIIFILYYISVHCSFCNILLMNLRTESFFFKFICVDKLIFLDISELVTRIYFSCQHAFNYKIIYTCRSTLQLFIYACVLEIMRKCDFSSFFFEVDGYLFQKIFPKINNLIFGNAISQLL